MQTLEFTRSLTEITKELKIPELVALLNSWLVVNSGGAGLSDPDKDRFAKLVFNSNSGYDWLLRTETNGKILEHLNVAELYEAGRLRRIVSLVTQVQNMQHLQNNTDVLRLFETLKSLQRLEMTCKALLETEKVGEPGPSTEVFELELIDYDGTGIAPERLARFAVVLRKLHTNFARIHNIEGDTLRFKYFDSGSSLLVGVAAAIPIAVSMSKLLLGWWEKTRFAKFESFDRKMEAVSTGLAALSEIREAISKGILDEATGENLKRRVCQEADQLIGLGATLPLKETAEVDQLQLLRDRRDTKLLGTGLPSEDDENAGG
jgi:hypothetical protein